MSAFIAEAGRPHYIGVALQVGHLTPKQMIRIAEIADLYGSGEIRLTVWQNFIIPNVPDAFVETVKKALVKAGLHWQQSNLRSGLIACTAMRIANSRSRIRRTTRSRWRIISRRRSRSINR